MPPDKVRQGIMAIRVAGTHGLSGNEAVLGHGDVQNRFRDHSRSECVEVGVNEVGGLGAQVGLQHLKHVFQPFFTQGRIVGRGILFS